MGTAIPTPLRAAAGLAAATIDEARRLPGRLVGFPVLAVSTALQTSLKVQQHYADLVTRGDELLAQLRPEPDDAPSWATFDDEFDGEPDVDSADGYAAADTNPDVDPATDADPTAATDQVAPVAGYDEMSVPQLRGRLRQLSEADLESLLAYETATRARAPYLTMLGNRLRTVRQG